MPTLFLLAACSSVAPPELPRAPGWLALRTGAEGRLPETPPHLSAPLLVPDAAGLEDARPGHRYTVWSEHGQLPATVVDRAPWPCGGEREAVAFMARGRLPDEGPLWIVPGPPGEKVQPLRRSAGQLGNLAVRSDERFTVALGDDTFHDGPLDHPHDPRVGWLRADRSALLVLSRTTPTEVVFRPVDLDRDGATAWRDIHVPRCR